jgi:shikimate kinase
MSINPYFWVRMMANKNKIFVIGFMGSGKTTLGKKLAKKLEKPFFDLDQVIENSEKRSINQIFEQFGEAHFRELETKTLQSLILEHTNFVLSLGGGTPCNQINMDLINESGTSIYLNYKAGMLASRLIGAKAERPMIKTLDKDQLKDFITTKLIEREPFYSQAQLVIESTNVHVDDLLEMIEKN